MVLRWADELPDHEPQPRLEPFFIFVALNHGDPRTVTREEFEKTFNLFFGYLHRPCTHESAMVQYIIWDDREKTKQQLKHMVDTRT